MSGDRTKVITGILYEREKKTMHIYFLIRYEKGERKKRKKMENLLFLLLRFSFVLARRGLLFLLLWRFLL